MSIIVTSYIARKEDFQKAITEQNLLSCFVVYDNGSTVYTQLSNPISSVRRNTRGGFSVITTERNRELDFKLI